MKTKTAFSLLAPFLFLLVGCETTSSHTALLVPPGMQYATSPQTDYRLVSGRQALRSDLFAAREELDNQDYPAATASGDKE